MLTNTITGTFLAALISLSCLLNAQTNAPDQTQFTLYGFGKTNVFWDNQNLGSTDLFVPANIKIGAPKEPNFFIGAKQTRIGFDVKQTLASEVLSIKLEGDFHNDASNANGLFRMRHAFANYKWLLVGMTWSNFFDPDVNPVVVDFEGPNSSTLMRTPQIRFSTYKTKNVFSVSLENPIEKITVGDSITVLPVRVPDVIAGYRINGNFGFVKVAGLLRELRYQSDEARSLLSYGATIMTSINVGKKDKLRFQGVMGTGVASYIQGASSLNYDAIYNGTNQLQELKMYGSNISYQHFWKDAVYTSVTAGILNAEENDALGPNNFKSGYYASVNLFWEAVKNLAFGAEVVAGSRQNYDGATGSAIRLQFNATYSFHKSFTN